MANAYGLVASPAQAVRGKNHACTSIYRSAVISTRVHCSSNVEGAETLGAGVAASESRVPR